MILILIFCWLGLSRAKLPPGFEDEIYCPKGMCLVKEKHERGWSGSITHYLKCLNHLDNTSRHPRAWGNQVNQSVKNNIIENGWEIAEYCKDTLITNGLFISNCFKQS